MQKVKLEGRKQAPVFHVLSILCLISLLAPARASAQTALDHRWEIFAESGASSWNDQFMDESILFGNPPEPQTLLITTHIGSSARLFLGARVWMDSHEAIEASYSYAPADITVNRHCEHVNCGVASFSSIARSHLVSINYVRAFREGRRLRPFLTAGLGRVYFHKVAMNGVFEPNPFTFNVGGGLDIQISRRWSLRAEYRDWMLEGPRQCDFDSCGATGLSDNQGPMVGLVFSF